MRFRNWGGAFSLALGTALSIAACAPADAADFTITKVGIDPSVGSRTGVIYFPGLTGGHEKVQIGRLLLQGTDSAGGIVSFSSYCADILDLLQKGTFSDAPVSALNYDSSRIAAVTAFLTHADPLVVDADTSAAAQLGVWEILNETSGSPYNVLQGNFHISDTSLATSEALANNWLSNLASANWQPDAHFSLAVLDPGAGNQPQIRIVSTPPGSPLLSAVPEPASWAMMAGGFAFLGGALRSQRRQREGRAAA